MFDFQFPGFLTPYINTILKQGAESRISDSDFVIKEINAFMSSPKRADMIKGINYYRGFHDILTKERTAIGRDGKLEKVDNLPNNKIIDNQYRKLVNQKANYILGKQMTVDCNNKQYAQILNNLFDSHFDKTIKAVCEDSLNCGIGWMYVCYDDKGKFVFKRFNPWEIIPGWADEEHTRLDYAIRVYSVIAYEGKNRKRITKTEVFDKKGIKRFVLEGGKLIPDGTDWQTPYFYRGDTPINWSEIPLIGFKYNAEEIPLINFLKSLQDGYNMMLSSFQNGMEEDPRNTILVLKNYDGENLGEFRKNLAMYGAVKVRTADGSQGGVETLSIAVNSENYRSIIEIFKKAIIENGMGYDAKDDRLSGNPNQMNIQSMYSDIDLDADGMEVEYKASLEKVLWFVNAHITNTGQGSYDNEQVDFIFNRDILINESEAIDNCIKSKGLLSDETIIAQHPWVNDPEQELKRLKKQEESLAEKYPLPGIGAEESAEGKEQ